MEAIKPEDLNNHIGAVRSTSWFTVTQEMINQFADVSDDHQFIHVDPEQATPIFGSTIAHGALMLSLSIGKGYETALVVEGTKMAILVPSTTSAVSYPFPIDKESIKAPCAIVLPNIGVACSGST